MDGNAGRRVEEEVVDEEAVEEEEERVGRESAVGEGMTAMERGRRAELRERARET